MWEIVTLKGFWKNTIVLSQNTHICGKKICMCPPSIPAQKLKKKENDMLLAEAL